MRPGGFEEAGRQPVRLLLGLTVGTTCAFFGGVFVPPLAPIPPLLVCGATILFKRTQAFALGALAAACGVLAFVVTIFVLLWVF
jgi:hypothetical protein